MCVCVYSLIQTHKAQLKVSSACVKENIFLSLMLSQSPKPPLKVVFETESLLFFMIFPLFVDLLLSKAVNNCLMKSFSQFCASVQQSKCFHMALTIKKASLYMQRLFFQQNIGPRFNLIGNTQTYKQVTSGKQTLSVSIRESGEIV